MAILDVLKTKLLIKISLMKEKRRRRSGSLYPRIVPQHLSQIDLGEELTGLENELQLKQPRPLPRVPTPTSLLSISSTTIAVDSRSHTQREHPAVLQCPLEDLELTGEQICEPQEILWPVDISRNVQLIKLHLGADFQLSGSVIVANLAYHKNIFVRWTTNSWSSYQDQAACYSHSSDDYCKDWFTFTVDPFSGGLTVDLDTLISKGVQFELAVCYMVNGMEHWDNNQRRNFIINADFCNY